MAEAVHPHGCGEHTDHNILLIHRNNGSGFSTGKNSCFFTQIVKEHLHPVDLQADKKTPV